MNRKAELKRLAKETQIDAGVYQIKNNRNGKVLIQSTRNLKTINGQQFMLDMGSHTNRMLQLEWNELGAAAFTFEVLEILEKPEMGYFDEMGELKKLALKWLNRLQPYGEGGYNARPEVD